MRGYRDETHIQLVSPIQAVARPKCVSENVIGFYFVKNMR